MLIAFLQAHTRTYPHPPNPCSSYHSAIVTLTGRKVVLQRLNAHTVCVCARVHARTCTRACVCVL